MEVSAAGIWQLGPKGLQMNRLSCFTYVALQALHWSCACFCVLLFGLELSLGLGLYTCTTLKGCSSSQQQHPVLASQEAISLFISKESLLCTYIQVLQQP